MSKSRWAQASREDLEALAEAYHLAPRVASDECCAVLRRLRASCPPLRTEAEVAAEALAILRNQPRHPTATLGDSATADRLRVLAKEPTRD